MTYTVISAEELMSHVANVRKRYQNNNPKKLHLISLLETLTESVVKFHQTASYDEYKALCFAAWLSCSSSIEVNKPYLCSLGSLHAILASELKIESLQTIDVFDKLTYLTKLYRFVTEQKSNLIPLFTQRQLEYDQFKDELLHTMRSLLQSQSLQTTQFLKALPNETALTQRMKDLPRQYQKEVEKQTKNSYFQHAHNPHHTFLANLTAAIADIATNDSAASDKKTPLRSERVKLGINFFYMRFIYNQYTIRNAHYSILYHCGYEILNQNEITDINADLQMTSLAALIHFLDETNLKKLEEILDCDKFDLKMLQVKNDCQQMITALNQQPTMISSTLKSTAAILGALSLASPSYGLGHTVGYGVAAMNGAVNIKIGTSKMTGEMMAITFGKSGKSFAYFASNMIVDATLERLFAKVFELLGMAIGASLGVSISIIVYDLSYQALRQLCQCCLNLKPTLDTTFAKAIQENMLQCLLSLPDEVFQLDDKNRLSAITAHSVFAPNAQANNNQLLLTDNTTDNTADNQAAAVTEITLQPS